MVYMQFCFVMVRPLKKNLPNHMVRQQTVLMRMMLRERRGVHIYFIHNKTMYVYVYIYVYLISSLFIYPCCVSCPFIAGICFLILHLFPINHVYIDHPISNGCRTRFQLQLPDLLLLRPGLMWSQSKWQFPCNQLRLLRIPM